MIRSENVLQYLMFFDDKCTFKSLCVFVPASLKFERDEFNQRALQELQKYVCVCLRVFVCVCLGICVCMSWYRSVLQKALQRF